MRDMTRGYHRMTKSEIMGYRRAFLSLIEQGKEYKSMSLAISGVLEHCGESTDSSSWFRVYRALQNKRHDYPDPEFLLEWAKVRAPGGKPGRRQ